MRFRHSSETSGDYGVQVYSHGERFHGSFMDAVQRRNDTFYVVSFKNVRLLPQKYVRT